ncbi:hypothetical protein K439DRAFT_922062 [Ramaria rubella]|nr:hypothetical protein K439DRAFT_922062 [Ramaria rubella]
MVLLQTSSRGFMIPSSFNSNLANCYPIWPQGRTNRFSCVRLQVFFSSRGRRMDGPHFDPSKFSAKYLPRLMTAWINNEGALNSHACMLNLIASNAVLNFGRFMELPEARGMVALQVKRMATENDYLRRNDDPRRYDADDLGEIGQFLSSLLMYQGDSDVDPRHRAVVINKLTAVWSRYGNGFAGVTSERCLEYLEGDPLSIMA